MKRIITAAILVLLVAGSACAPAAGTLIVSPYQSPVPVVVAPPTVVVQAPSRVYYDGRWLYHRQGAYHYYSAGSWVVAPAVPFYVSRYHVVHPHYRHHRYIHYR